jgi:hypothetical protein
VVFVFVVLILFIAIITLASKPSPDVEGDDERGESRPQLSDEACI